MTKEELKAREKIYNRRKYEKHREKILQGIRERYASDAEFREAKRVSNKKYREQHPRTDEEREQDREYHEYYRRGCIPGTKPWKERHRND